VPKIWGFPLTLIVALTTVFRTTVLHCDNRPNTAAYGTAIDTTYAFLAKSIICKFSALLLRV